MAKKIGSTSRKPAPKASRGAAAKPAPKPSAKHSARPSAKVAPKPISKPNSKPVAKPATKSAPAGAVKSKLAAKTSPAKSAPSKSVSAKPSAKISPARPTPKSTPRATVAPPSRATAKIGPKNVKTTPPKPSAANASGKGASGTSAGGKPSSAKTIEPKPNGKAPAGKSSPSKNKGSEKSAVPAVRGKGAPPPSVKSTAKASAAPAKPKGRSGSKTLKLGDKSSSRSVAAAAAAAPKTDAHGYVVINGRRVRMMSTKDISLTKKPKNTELKSGTALEAVDVSGIKTKLSKKELEHYSDLLLQKRAEILGLVEGMEQEALRSNGGNLSHMPIHMADIGSDTADQDFALNLAEKERETINEIDAALQRIDDGIYGVCQATGKPIPKARLDAKPWAKYTIEAARMVESGHRF